MIIRRILIVAGVLLLVGLAIAASVLFGSATHFSEKKKTLYIATNAAHKQAVLDSLVANSIIKSPNVFNWVAAQMDYWETIKPGRYDIEQGVSLFALVRRLRNGQQTPVNLVINKLRTTADFANLVGRKLETDSAKMIAYLQSDSFAAKRKISEGEVLAFVLPDTYTYFWNTTPDKIFQKLVDAYRNFWTAERLAKAERLSMTPVQVATLASIVDEETNAQSEKGTIASVYLNRLKRGMPLQADPTVRFALQDFTIKRVYHKHLQVESPYNTYKNAGLPPGPICTPQKKTIDAVLDAPNTEYLYFVASPKFNGTHEFSTNYTEHLAKAKLYQQALTLWQQQQLQKQQTANAQ